MRRVRHHFGMLVLLGPLALSGGAARAGYDGLPFLPPIVPPFEPLPPGPPPPPPPPIPPTGAVTSIAPFAGMLGESFESRNNFLTPFYHTEPDPMPIMGGAAALSTAQMGIYEPGLAEFGIGIPIVMAKVADGTKGMGMRIDNTTNKVLVFESPITHLGAFWATGSPSNGATLTFYDPLGNPVDAPSSFAYTRNGSFTGGDGVLEWHGWHSTTPFQSVNIVGDYVAVDALRVRPAGQFTLDNFNSGNGHFDSHPGFSGTSAGQTSASTSTRDTSTYVGDRGASMRLNIDDDPSVNAPDGTGWRTRFLSGVGTPANNANLDEPGWVGFWMKTSAPNLRAALMIDDDLALERSTRLPVTADGEWHLYQWNLADADDWNAFAGTAPNGAIDATRVTIDSLYFDTTSIGPVDADAVFWIDNVTWSPTQIVLPEPAALGALYTGAVALLLRRRLRPSGRSEEALQRHS